MECQTVLSYINAKTPWMGIVPTQWNHKTSCPMYKKKSKCKTLNGCYQMCIKTVKMTQKYEKPQGEASTKAWSTKKMEVERMEKMKWRPSSPCRPNLHDHITLATNNYKIVTLPLRFTKMPLWASNVDPLTLLTWKWHGNDVAMMWKVSSTKY